MWLGGVAGSAPLLVGYVVVEQGLHHFASGATLIAGEALLPLPPAGDSSPEAVTMRTVPFQQPFGRCPALLTTLAASTQHVRPRCIGGAAAARYQARARP